MIPFEDIKIFLPKYLSPDSEENLFKALEEFPANLDDRLYTSYHKDDPIIFQGDGFNDFLVINFPNPKIDTAPVMILSNSCDINPANERLFDSSICYAPIFKLNKYKESLLKRGKGKNKVEGHISEISRQRIAQIFYLPKNDKIKEDSFIFFDRIISSPTACISKSRLKDIRLFTLSNYGLFLFLFKLSIHFFRIRENIDRDK